MARGICARQGGRKMCGRKGVRKGVRKEVQEHVRKHVVSICIYNAYTCKRPTRVKYIDIKTQRSPNYKRYKIYII